ncbi:MAG: hypothetical protein DRI90_06635 [Deltaproteobacteria bacterium]|nr:MAG: hypothetical protein DRI90_06635 [Deltaproteobacteria bacterium]
MQELIGLHKSTRTLQQKREAAEALLAKLPEEHGAARQSLLLGLVRRQIYDEPRWVTLTTRFRGHTAEIEVSADALRLHGIRFDLTAEGAQQVADMLGTILPTPFILELIWEQADIQLEPCTLPADAKMATTTRMIRHSRCVDEKIAGRQGLVANVGKHWVLSNRLGEPAGKRRNVAANFGWFRHGRRPIQTVGTVHDTAHTDYSQVVRLIKPMIQVNGHPMHIRHVGSSHELWGLVSDEGPLRFYRASPHHSQPIAHAAPKAAPPPKRPNPPAVSASLGLTGFPLNPKQLPEHTVGLRQNRLLAEIAAGLRMPRASLPKEALWSNAAGFCGVHDVFFDLLNGVPVSAAKLTENRETLKQGLACGRKWLAGIEAGASRYEIDYAVEGPPSLFTLFPTEVTRPLEAVSLAALSPTPGGVFAAVCRDDLGGAQATCRDGDQARLLFELKGGLLGTYAQGAPSLLSRFAASQAPTAEVLELSQVFAELATADDVMVERGRHCTATLTRSLVGLAPLPDGHATLAESLGKHATLCASARTGDLGYSSWTYVYRARDKNGVAVIERALAQRAAQLKVEPAYPEHLSDTERGYTKVLHMTRRRSLAEAAVVAQGNALRVTLQVTPTAPERRAMLPFQAQQETRAEAAARVIRALSDGETPSKTDLQIAAGKG